MPRANLTLRRVPEGMSDEVALFAGDVMGTGYHAIAHAGMRAGDTVAVLGLGPVGLCAVQAALAGGAAQVFAIDTVAAAAGDGGRVRRDAAAPHRGGAEAGGAGARPTGAASTSSSTRSATRVRWRWRSASPATPAPSPGSAPTPGKGEVPLGPRLAQGADLRLGLANVIAHVDRVLALIEAGKLDPAPLVTHHMKLDEAAEAYALYDRREALKIVLTP